MIVPPPRSPNIDLTTAQIFVDPCRLPRTPPRQESPERSSHIITFRQDDDNHSQDILEDFREVRQALHTYTPRQPYLQQPGLQLYQARQFCLMPCHRCVASEDMSQAGQESPLDNFIRIFVRFQAGQDCHMQLFDTFTGGGTYDSTHRPSQYLISHIRQGRISLT